jgi:hypothetical protein
MQPGEQLFNIISIWIILLVFVTLASPKFVWSLRKPFLYTNRLQWMLLSPFRKWLRDPNSSWPRRRYLAAFPLITLYSAFVYVLLFPVRFINAFYFDILLFWSVCLRDGLLALAFPHYQELNRFRRMYLWLYYLPQRLVRFIGKYILVLLQGLAMVCFDLLWPTLTLFHGTDKSKAEKIATTGEWLAGAGDYAGTGIYFGLEQEVAEHYIRARQEALVVVSRVTLTPCRSISTLPMKVRAQIGSDGDAISRSLSFPWVSLEHWRKDMQWYEFCFVQKTKYNPISPWRIRPICVIGKEAPERLVRGVTSWPKNKPGYSVLAGTLMVLLLPLLWLNLPIQQYRISETKSGAASLGINLQPAHLFNITLQVLKGENKAWGHGLSCPGAPPIRLEVGKNACTADIHPDTLRVRSAPTIFPENVLFRLDSGTRQHVLEGPYCADGYTWFKVVSEDGEGGWVAEGSLQNYFLEPCR